jgi:hypothetical protein
MGVPAITTCWNGARDLWPAADGYLPRQVTALWQQCASGRAVSRRRSISTPLDPRSLQSLFPAPSPAPASD